MKKSSLFISTILTVFVVAILAGTATAYRSLTANPTPTPQPTPVAQATPVPLTPEQAAQVAAQFWGHSDLYSVESSVLNGTTAYKVTFSSGDIIYISPDGQVMAAIAAPIAVPQNNTLSFQPAQPPAQPAQPVITYSGGEHEHEGGGDD
jgi:hypothetical protein